MLGWENISNEDIISQHYYMCFMESHLKNYRFLFYYDDSALHTMDERRLHLSRPRQNTREQKTKEEAGGKEEEVEEEEG